MKKIYSILMLSLCVVFAGCDESNDFKVPQPINVITADYDFSSQGGNGVIELEPTGAAMQAVSDMDWLKPSVNGNKVTFTVPVYTGLSGRNAIITITSGNRKTLCTVQQQGALFIVGKDNLSFKVDGGEESFPFEIMLGYDIVKSDEWFDYTINDNMMTVTANPYTGKMPRSGTITVTASRDAATIQETVINILQDGTGFVYGDYVGTWTFNGIYAFTGESREFPLTFAVKTSGKSYNVSGYGPVLQGYLPAGLAMNPIEVQFINEKTLRTVNRQATGISSGGKALYFYLINNEGSFYPSSTTHSSDFVLDKVEDTKLIFRLKNNGTQPSSFIPDGYMVADVDGMAYDAYVGVTISVEF